MPAHTVNGTGAAVYAVRASGNGCQLAVARVTGPVGRASVSVKTFPLQNCLGEAAITQPDGQLFDPVVNDIQAPSDVTYDDATGAL